MASTIKPEIPASTLVYFVRKELFSWSHDKTILLDIINYDLGVGYDEMTSCLIIIHEMVYFTDILLNLY